MRFESELSIDIETFSATDLKKAGLQVYAENVETLLLSYAYDDDEVTCIDLVNGERIPKQVMRDLTRRSVRKKAFNAPFEIECLSSEFNLDLDFNQWECTMVRAAMCGLPMSLDGVTKAVRVDEQKDKSGASLIRYFSMPCKPTKANGGRTRNMPWHDPEKWEQYKTYNKLDVYAERAVSRKLSFYHISKVERNYWILDQIIARNGILADRRLIENAISMDQQYRLDLLNEATKITGLQNANSVAQIKAWLSEELDEEITTLKKSEIPILLAKTNSLKVKRIINIRQDLAKSSVAKYYTMRYWLCHDDRLRGMIQHYGAGRTGRAAGRGPQPQNFTRGNISDILTARRMVERKDSGCVAVCYGAVPEVLSSLLRSALIASPGKKLLISDYSAIEAMVLAWLAGENWRLKVFREGGDIYKTSAALMLSKAFELIDSVERQIGKVCELALGYGGGVFALTTSDTQKKIKDDDKQSFVDAWRAKSPKIVTLWKTVEKAAKRCIEYGETITITKGIKFEYKRGYLFITLPSGRKLSYAQATLKPGREWGTKIVYGGLVKNKWVEVDTYGGKLVENIVQAIARDCLYYGMMNVHRAGFKICLHVHDEVVCEGKTESIKDMDRIFSQVPPWASGLPLKAKGFESTYYKK